MDHNLSDALNLDSSMGVDFGNSETNITLEDSGHEGGIPMEFEHIEEQPMLMDTGSEEIIDFIGEQFTLQEYNEHEDQSNVLPTNSIQSNLYTSQSDVTIEIEATTFKSVMKQGSLGSLTKTMMPKIPMSPSRSAITKKPEPEVHTTAPRQIAIAPKPPPSAQSSKAYVPGKQFAIAPKPIALLTGKNNSFLKKVTLASVMQGNTKGNTVFTQIGKQLVMVPGGGPKLKVLSAGTNMPTVQYIRASTAEQTAISQAKNVASHKPIVTKLILQGQSNSDGNSQQAVLTKVNSLTGAKSPTRFVTMQQKTVPLSLGNKVLLATPTKTGVKFAKKQQIIAFKSPEKVSQATQGTMKKVLITSNPSQNVILKTTAPPKTTPITKDGSIVVEGQRSQLHQINVPGKGIQYIRLITNSNSAQAKPKPQQQPINVPAKTFLLTDNKGNLIQMSSEKMLSSGQPPPLLVPSSTAEVNQSNAKPQQKLMRIAPLVNKSTPSSLPTSRSSQSLLAPLSPMPEVQTICLDEAEEVDSKAAVRALVGEELRQNLQQEMEEMQRIDEEQNVQDQDTQDPHMSVTEVEVEFKRDFYSDCDENDSMDQQESAAQPEEHPLIVIPSNYIKDTDDMSDNQSTNDDSQMNSIISVDADVLNSYQSPDTPQALSDSDIVSTELGLRPRKACNCTKSQCLKLYCECFANGEFCNRCNCNNCHNNLENEELRQKAIRGCLDRNPNAFRPKIGKAKIGGPDIVRRHNKGCNCKRSGCLKNYCECYEAKIACTSICKCVGCRNVEETLERGRRRAPQPAPGAAPNSLLNTSYRPPPLLQLKQPCSFMTTEVIEAVCQCLLAAGSEAREPLDPTRDVIDEFAKCLQDIISAAHHSSSLPVLDEGSA